MGSELAESERRQQIDPTTDLNIIIDLQRMLKQNNRYIMSFKTAVEQGKLQEDYKIIIRADKRPPNQHRGRFNEPSLDEVAILLVGEAGSPRDIILHARDAPLQTIQDTHRSYDALQYPLLFCRGEDGYEYSVMQVGVQILKSLEIFMLKSKKL